jgi:HD-like signal output (HDOD) protein
MATNLAKKVGSGELTVKEFPQIVSKINTAIPLPSLPQLLFKLIEVCRDNSAGIENIVRIALLDPAVAAKLIRLSSNWLQGTADVRSLEKYIAVLGPANIRKLALVALATPITNTAMRHSAAKLFQFWHHSIQCAVLARKLAEREGSVSPGEAYLAGLLHDIGQLLLWTNFKKEYDPVFQDRPKDAVSISREENRIGTNHCEAGWRLVRETSLHPMIADAILYHHRPAEEIRYALPHVRIVHAANLICHREQDNYSLADELQSIGLQQTPAQIGSLVAETKRTVETVYRYLGLRPDVEFGSDLGESSEGFLPIYNFLREFRELSLVHIAAGDINADSEREGVQKELCLTLQILFDILPICFFFYNPTRNVLTGASTAGGSADNLLDGIEIPVKPGASLAAAAVINNEIVDSFGYLTAKRVSIADEQLLRLLGTEGLVCIPLENRGKHVGTIVGGIDESQFPVRTDRLAQAIRRPSRHRTRRKRGGRQGRPKHPGRGCSQPGCS